MKKIVIMFLLMLFLTGCKDRTIEKNPVTEEENNKYTTDEMLLDPGEASREDINEIKKSDTVILDYELKNSLSKEDVVSLLPQNGFSDAVILENGYLINYYSDDGLTVQIRKSSSEYTKEKFWETYNLFKDVDAFDYVIVENLADGAYSNQKGYLYLYKNNYMYNVNVLVSERYDANEKAVEIAKILLDNIG